MNVIESANPASHGPGEDLLSVGVKKALLDQLTEERTALEALALALTESGPLDQKLAHARRLVQDRLGVVKARLASGQTRGPGNSAGFRGDHIDLIGNSEAMRRLYQAIARVSHSEATVLLQGESGTGKELVAKAIHQAGPRAKGPFIALHCAAVTETLLESELFGHERGAFTGALEARKGRFELAHGGTLFLDEIGDIPSTTQVKLLRVLQERCFERVGGGRPIAVDVRVVSATHRDLEEMVRAGTFREDLYYRLNVVPVLLPPLRERLGDIPLLIDHFVAKFNRRNGRSVRLGADLRAQMVRYHWPGNIRELQNCVERLVVMADSETVTLETVPLSLRGYFSDMRQVSGGPGTTRESYPSSGRPLAASLRQMEREQLVRALEQRGWVQSRAARALGLTPRQVAYRIRKYGLSGGGLR